MALKEYEWQGRTYRFEEGEQPDGAKPVEAAKPARKPSAKRRTAAANKAKAAPADKGAR